MQQRNTRALIAFGCAVALLLPLLSIVDDDAANDLDAFVLVEGIVLAAALVALAIVPAQRHSLARFTLAALTDPRSPPRA